MRINVDADRKDIELAINWMGGLIGTAIDKRVAAFEKQERNNLFLTTYFRENFPLEFALAKARKYRKNTGHLPKGEQYDQLYSFAVATHRIHAALPAETKRPFEGRLHDAVNGAYGARPFAYEISIATHLMRKNWDVQLADYSGTERFDFLARLGASEIEVECKTTSGDTGRKIHRQEANRLADLALATQQRLADIPGCHLIRLIIANRLGKAKEDLARIASVISTAAESRTKASNDLAEAEYVLDDLDTWPEPDGSFDVQDFFQSRFGLANPHLVLHGRPGFSVVVVAITSARADSVVKAITDQAKDAADQCTGTRPALIALHLIDPIDPSKLAAMLKTANGMHAIAGSVFEGSKRLHVDSIAFTVPQQTQMGADGSKSVSGPVLVLNNPHPQFPSDALRSIFR
jgi:hypothetical protein